jgi:hypothetical protein
MEATDELRKWVEILTISEKRFITLLGKAKSGAKPSQHLTLFAWLNQADESSATPEDASFLHNLPTVSLRLKELILDGLRLLHKEDNTDALLRTTIDEIAMLLEKKLFAAAKRQLKRAKKLALDRCRYLFVLQCIEAEQKLFLSTSDPDFSLDDLYNEEQSIRVKLNELRDLQYRHEKLLAVIKQVPYHRDPSVSAAVKAIAEHELVNRQAATGDYLERATAVNILGIRDLYLGRAPDAVIRYQALLNEWQQHPGWQADQVSLLLLICKFYQSACFLSPVNWEQVRKHITMFSNFNGLSADAARDFKRLLFHNEFGLALNSGNFETVKQLIPEIDLWIRQEEKQLTSAQQLSFLCNFAVAEFLSDNFREANNFILRIVNMPEKNSRKDIRDFAVVLQAVLHYELNNSELNEYLTRAGKRKFSNKSVELNFEGIVFSYLQKLITGKQSGTKKLEAFITELQQLEAAKQESAAPLLGLKEIQLWAQSKLENKSLKSVFLDEVKRNLELLEKAEKIV